MAIIVTAIRPYSNGHKKRVTLHDTETNATYTMTYGDSVTDKYIRLMAPHATSPRKAPKERKKPEYLPVSPSKQTGRVTFFNAEKNFGKINGKMFFHVSDFVDGNAAYIRKGVTVAYEEGVDRSDRVKAIDVQLVEAK